MTRPIRALALALIAGLCAGGEARAAGRASLVVDANTGQDLYVRDANKPLYPASLTKMMTLYIVFDMIEQKRISYQTKIQITPKAASQPPSNLDLEAGATLTVREAVLALIVKSANDVACAIGENLAGSEEKFAQIMTARARQLGMHATTYRNASGLPDPAQVTTARDQSTLALRLIHDFPEHYKLFATRDVTINGRTHRSHNSLLHGFEGTDGIKTGYTRASGFNLVSSVRRGQKHVVGVVLGGVTAAQRNSQMRAILTQAVGQAKAMARPLLARRPTSLAEPTRVAERAPVPRRVAHGEPTAEPQAEPVATQPTPRPARTQTASAAMVAGAQRAPEPVPVAPSSAPSERAGPISAANGPGRPPATLQDQAQQVSASDHAASRLVEARPSEARAATPVARPPSGLGVKLASAGSAAAAAPVPASAGPGPGSARTAAAQAGPYHVQIGAFSNEAEAQRQLSAVSERAGGVFAGHAPLTLAVSRDNVQFFRARFAGFNEAKARDACQTLKQQKIECVVMRAE